MPGWNAFLTRAASINLEYWTVLLGLVSLGGGMLVGALVGLVKLIKWYLKWEGRIEQIPALEKQVEAIPDLLERVEDLEEQKCSRNHRSAPKSPPT